MTNLLYHILTLAQIKTTPNNRTKTPTGHSARKSYFIAWSEAWGVWDESVLKEVITKLKLSGLDDDDIEKKRYYDAKWFQARVPRRVPAPLELYYRLRAVYASFGDVVDEESGRALFNDKAWKKANAVLLEVLLGYLSDPPGYTMYTVELDDDGAPRKDRLGCQLYRCGRKLLVRPDHE